MEYNGVMILPETVLFKVRQFQNEFMKSSFLPKYEPKIVKISALCSKLILKLSDL